MNNLHWKSALKVIASTNGDDYILDHCYGEVNRNYFCLTHHGAPNIVICMEMDYMLGKIRHIHISTVDGNCIFMSNNLVKPTIRKVIDKFLSEVWVKENRFVKKYKIESKRAKDLRNGLTCYLTGVKEFPGGFVVLR